MYEEIKREIIMNIAIRFLFILMIINIKSAIEVNIIITFTSKCSTERYEMFKSEKKAVVVLISSKIGLSNKFNGKRLPNNIKNPPM